MDLTTLNVGKQNLIDGMATAGVMQVDLVKYWIPYNAILLIFNEVTTALIDLDNRLTIVEGQMANRMLCTKYKTD